MRGIADPVGEEVEAQHFRPVDVRRDHVRCVGEPQHGRARGPLVRREALAVVAVLHEVVSRTLGQPPPEFEVLRRDGHAGHLGVHDEPAGRP